MCSSNPIRSMFCTPHTRNVALSIIPFFIPRPVAKVLSNKTLRQNEWYVLICISEMSFTLSSCSNLIRNSSAAFSENVKHRISDGFSPFLSMNLILSVITAVFPLPGPAVISNGDPVCSIACFCSSLKSIHRLEYYMIKSSSFLIY